MTAQPFPLESLRSLTVTGPDARSFLQHQLSADLDEVTERRGQLSAWHDPKGRVLAVMRVMPWPHGFVLVMQSGLAAAIEQRLRMYVLRAKVTLQPGPPACGLADVHASRLPLDGLERGAAPLTAGCSEAVSMLRMPGRAGWLIVGALGETAGPINHTAAADWELAELEAGIPEVYPETSGQFVAQMLNLDRLGAVSFTKGCYPGQEIVARAHHLGRVKRRARLFDVAGAAPVVGASLDDPGGTVIRVAAKGDGCLLMAVVPDDSTGPFTLPDGRPLEPFTPPAAGP
jgi:tRNA-modifying protein YgfZ